MTRVYGASCRLSLISNTRDVVRKQPLLVLLLLEEDPEGVTDIEDADWFRNGAEHRHIMAIPLSHFLPGCVDTGLWAARYDVSAHQVCNRRLCHSHVRQMAHNIGLTDDACSPAVLVTHHEKSDVRAGKRDGRAT